MLFIGFHEEKHLCMSNLHFQKHFKPEVSSFLQADDTKLLIGTNILMKQGSNHDSHNHGRNVYNNRKLRVQLIRVFSNLLKIISFESFIEPMNN